MNRLVLRSGRMPQAANECVVHVMGYQAEIAEGTVLTLPEDTEGTKHKEYTVVGWCRTHSTSPPTKRAAPWATVS